MTLSTKPITPPSTLLLVLNGIGVITYLVFASRCWIEPELADFPGASGGAPIVWGLTALPILLFFALLDFIWGSALAVIYVRRRIAPLHPALLFVPIIWGAAIYLDFSRHGI
jgi:hypothetical protein